MTDLFSPIRIGPLTLRNRFIKSATNEGMAKGGVPSKLLVEHHRSMAAGGAAMTTVAYCAVSADGRTFTDQVQMTPEVEPHLRVLTDAVHREGGAACAQITHGGAFNFLPSLGTRYPRSASGGFNPPGILVGRYFRKAMTEAEMAQVAADFAAAAVRARDCGFDAVEIHMGHGYLLSQFLSPAYNRRRDDYGGTPERRARFPARVLRHVLDTVGKQLAVTCKLSVIEGFRGGAVAEDSAIVARQLEAEGAHLLVLSGGMNVESPWMIFGSRLPKEAGGPVDSALARLSAKMLYAMTPKIEFHEMYFLEHSRKVRAAVSMPLAYLGGVKSLRSAEQAMAEGFDCVVMGRALIHDPGLVNKFRSGAATDSGCTSCNECVARMYTPGGTSCALRTPNNPQLNREPAWHN